MRECANSTGLDMHIYGPETHVTAVVPLALGLAEPSDFPEFDEDSSSAPPSKKSRITNDGRDEDKKPAPTLAPQKADHEADHNIENFTALTRCVVYGLQHRAVQVRTALV